MVKSGLDPKNFEGPSDVPRVSQYRLASHLSTAMVLYSVLFWSSLDILAPAKKPQLGQAILPAIKKIRGMTMGVKALVFLCRHLAATFTIPLLYKYRALCI